VALDPDKPRFIPQRRSLIDLGDDGFNQVFILDGLPSCGLPIVLNPPLGPLGHAIDGVLGVGDDADVGVGGADAEGFVDGEEFGALICLAGAGEGAFGVSGEKTGQWMVDR